MKASDLMIGDWVYDTHSYNYNKEKEPVKLDRNEFVELICGCTGNNDLDLGDMYEPVPLTEEVLKSNGFTKSKDERYYYAPNDNRFILGFMGGYANLPAHIFVECGFYPVTIKYVHELQHAIRLLGLDELADNFKL